MQHFVLAVVAAAAVTSPGGEARRLKEQFDMDQNLLAEARKDTESATAGVASAKSKAAEVEKEVEGVKQENDQMGVLVTKKEENDKEMLQAEVLSDKAKLATAKQAHEDLAGEVKATEEKVKADEASVKGLRAKVVNEQRAFLNAHQAAASVSESMAGKPAALAQLDPSPVTDKTPGKDGVPEQGFEGQAVAHKDMETITEDWGAEYGAEMKGKMHLAHKSFATSAALLLVAVLGVSVTPRVAGLPCPIEVNLLLLLTPERMRHLKSVKSYPVPSRGYLRLIAS